MKISGFSKKLKLLRIFFWSLGLSFFVFIFPTLFLQHTFAASFNIDFLNLQEAFPNLNLPKAYFKVGLKEAWERINGLNLNLSPVIIGIVDTGFDSKHPEFAEVNFGNTPLDAKTDSGELIDSQLESHGTNIAGIIGANNISAISPINYIPPHMNGILSGVKNLNYTLEIRKRNKLIDKFTAFSAAKKIIETVDSGSTIVSLSFAGFNIIGTVVFNSIFLVYPNTLFVVAAGNSNWPVAFFTPANLGAVHNIITVGATTLNDQRDPDSNYGDAVSISAPGEFVFSPTFFQEPLGADDYEDFSGTSASAPMVTGVAGLIKAIKPELTSAQIKQILIETADPIQTGELNKRIGTGCYSNPNDPLNTGCRLNAYKAVCHPLVLNCTPAPSILTVSDIIPSSVFLSWTKNTDPEMPYQTTLISFPF